MSYTTSLPAAIHKVCESGTVAPVIHSTERAGYRPCIEPDIRALLIDDEEIILDVTSRFLKRSGRISATCCNSGDQAFELLKTEKFDVIISDYDMPEMNGIRLLVRLRSEGIHTPFILFTGRGREEVVIEALNNGASHYLRKGGDPRSLYAELVNVIIQVVEKSRYEEQVHERELLISSIFQHLPDPTYATDLSGKIITWNRAMEEISGIRFSGDGTVYQYTDIMPLYRDYETTPGDLILGRSSFLPEEFTIVQQTLDMLMTEMPYHEREEDIPSWWRIKTSRLRSASGQTIGVIESMRDITAEKNAERDLSRMNSYHRMLIESHIDPLFTVEKNLMISDLNQASERCTGKSKQDLIGSSFISLFEEKEYLKEIFCSLLDTPSLIENVAVKMKTRIGNKPVFLFATSCPHQDGRSERLFIEIHETEPEKKKIRKQEH